MSPFVRPTPAGGMGRIADPPGPADTAPADPPIHVVDSGRWDCDFYPMPEKSVETDPGNRRSHRRIALHREIRDGACSLHSHALSRRGHDCTTIADHVIIDSNAPPKY